MTMTMTMTGEISYHTPDKREHSSLPEYTIVSPSTLNGSLWESPRVHYSLSEYTNSLPEYTPHPSMYVKVAVCGRLSALEDSQSGRTTLAASFCRDSSDLESCEVFGHPPNRCSP